MLVNQLAVPKLNSVRYVIIILVAIYLLIGLGNYGYWGCIPNRDKVALEQTSVPLLLNSGVVTAKETKVNVIIWFEDEDIPSQIWTNRPTSDWKWTYNALQNGSGKAAVTLSGNRQMNKNEEKSLYTWYTTMAKLLSKTGGRIYLDERVPQSIDVAAYLSQTNALPAQWSLLNNLVSIAAYQNSLETSVRAGQDRINIQLLSRGMNAEGQTVLAIPALLEEF